MASVRPGLSGRMSASHEDRQEKDQSKPPSPATLVPHAGTPFPASPSSLRECRRSRLPPPPLFACGKSSDETRKRETPRCGSLPWSIA